MCVADEWPYITGYPLLNRLVETTACYPVGIHQLLVPVGGTKGNLLTNDLVTKWLKIFFSTHKRFSSSWTVTHIRLFPILVLQVMDNRISDQNLFRFMTFHIMNIICYKITQQDDSKYIYKRDYQLVE